MARRLLGSTGLAAVLALASGCSLIASITLSSDWVSGSSTSIAGSSEGLSRSSFGSDAGAAVAYLADVRVLAEDAAAGGRTGGELSRELTRVAARHGIADWESEPDTLRAVGEGLRRAGVARDDLPAWGEGLGIADAEAARARLLEGWETAGL
ncbi:MAG TPA: putative lipoprotein [Myxococcota bacterium]|nr:putative lipoprotein [Myxococcota bacterium]